MSNNNETKTSVEVTIAGRPWIVTVTDMNKPYAKGRYYWRQGKYVEARTRVFVSTPDEFDEIFFDVLAAPHPSVEMFPALALESVYTTRKEYPEVDKAWDKHNRAFVKGQQAVLSAVEHLTGVTKAKYDRRAGCSCPCSPGFIATEGGRSRGAYFWISVEPAA